jgi:hypothetical protein
MAGNSNRNKSTGGFASMDESKQKDIASKGGKTSSSGNKKGSNQSGKSGSGTNQ